MAFNQLSNRNLKQDFAETARLNFMSDIIPSTIKTDIQPVMIVEKKHCNIVRSIESNTSGTITLYSVPSSDDFYLSSIELSYFKNAACDMSTGNSIAVLALIEGNSRRLINVATVTATSAGGNIVMNYSPPLKIDKGTNITITGTFTAGECIRGACLTGYSSNSIGA